jgi:predicted flap endonuclease-1-like 5' DNA nuclease
MSYLLAKIFCLMLLSAAFGAWLAYWWTRRNYLDVSSEYSRLESDWNGWRRDFEAKLGAKTSVDFTPLNTQFNALGEAVRGIKLPTIPSPDFTPVLSAIAAAPKPKDNDFSTLFARFNTLDSQIKNLPTPALVDLNPLLLRLNALENSVKAIQIPPAKEVDFAPIHDRLGVVEKAIRAVQVPQSKDIDFAPVLTRLLATESLLRSLQIPAAKEPDLSATNARLAALEAALRAIVIPPSQTLDLSPVLKRLDALQAAPTSTTLLTNASAPAAAWSDASVRSGSKNLLTEAAYGKPDDLKLIKGVAGVLEKMLHNIGVYYFWQVADWSAEDIAYADRQLEVFKGRIERDHWVDQCREFAKRTESARKPG